MECGRVWTREGKGDTQAKASAWLGIIQLSSQLFHFVFFSALLWISMVKSKLFIFLTFRQINFLLVDLNNSINNLWNVVSTIKSGLVVFVGGWWDKLRWMDEAFRFPSTFSPAFQPVPDSLDFTGDRHQHPDIHTGLVLTFKFYANPTIMCSVVNLGEKTVKTVHVKRKPRTRRR